MTVMKIIDAHHHSWQIKAAHHQWPTPDEAAIYRDFEIRDLTDEAASSQAIGIDSAPQLVASVLVQSQPDARDTAWMLERAAKAPLVQAVVGWADLLADDAPRQIAALARHPLLRGLRPMLQSIPDTDWLLRDDLAPAICAMIDHGLRLDALVQPRHLPMLARFAARYPQLPIVIDHAAKPRIAAAPDAKWRDDMMMLADQGLWCKLSGLRTEQSPDQPADNLTPYAQQIIRQFGPRLMWGSDWPVLHLAGDQWGDWYQQCAAWAAGTIDAERLFHGAAAEFYSINIKG